MGQFLSRYTLKRFIFLHVEFRCVQLTRLKNELWVYVEFTQGTAKRADMLIDETIAYKSTKICYDQTIKII
jgi:hypothetical protein